MGIHPNAMLLVLLDPDEGSRKTYRELFERLKAKGVVCEPEYEDDGTGQFELPNGSDGKPTEECPGGEPMTDDYCVKVLESDFYEGLQIRGKEGQLAIWDLVTYGYGEKIRWSALEAKKVRLCTLLDELAPGLHFRYEVFISANYW